MNVDEAVRRWRADRERAAPGVTAPESQRAASARPRRRWRWWRR
ncbi:hypothetical protein O7630_11955 [Micromonospora sp. WMMD718]|nr:MULTISPECIES: hypothetical protein [unclassified Micromonospora]MDG4751656.1 hypothetical protein [Micromonospora sp. WMMD718]